VTSDCSILVAVAAIESDVEWERRLLSRSPHDLR
jgi:hypothetical protein